MPNLPKKRSPAAAVTETRASVGAANVSNGAVEHPRHDALLTVRQTEEKHPALRGRLRTWIHRADCGDPEFVHLRHAVIRIGRSVFLSETHFQRFIDAHRMVSPAPRRN